jgi:hypothetical protein
MRFADRIALHSEAVDGLRRHQIDAIRAEVTAQRLSVRALGKIVGQHDLRGINHSQWWPSQETLDKLEPTFPR